MKKVSISLLLIGVCISNAFSESQDPQLNVKGTIIDRVVAVVNGSPVCLSELDLRVAFMKRMKGAQKDANRNSVLDIFINELIIQQTADKESIQVTETRIDNQIADIMKEQKITDIDVFIKQIETTHGIPYPLYRLQIKNQLLSEQLMMYVVDYTPPSKSDVQAVYNQFKNKPDLVQLNLKQILIRPKSNSLPDQKAATDKLKSIQARIAAGESFESIARKESQDPSSAAKGGDLGWKMLLEMDRDFAGQALQMYKPNSVSGIIRTNSGFLLVKFMGKRVAPYESIENMIYSKIAYDRRIEQFNKWLVRERKTAEVQIYLEGYKVAKD